MQFDVGTELAARYGLDPELCAGAQIGDQPWQRAPYFVRSPGPKPPVTLATLRIKSWHNFGNLVYQLLHALAFAEEQGVRRSPARRCRGSATAPSPGSRSPWASRSSARPSSATTSTRSPSVSTSRSGGPTSSAASESCSTSVPTTFPSRR